MFSTTVSQQAKQKFDTFKTEVARRRCKQACSGKNFKQQVKKASICRGAPDRILRYLSGKTIADRIANSCFETAKHSVEVAFMESAKVEDPIAISNTSSNLL